MSEIRIERRRSGWDLILGVLVVLAGLVILGNVVLATVVSVLFIGWVAVIAGVIALVAALSRIGGGGFWAAALSGGLMLVLGLMLVRNPGVGALALTLVAGALFLSGGIVRIVAGVELSRGRGVLLFSGIVSAVLGLIVVLNIWTASLTLLGTLLGLQVLMDGITLLLFGRLHVSRSRSERVADSRSAG
jgi:membrane protein HdeD